MFSKEKVNTGRQIEIDLARGLAAIIIIICHTGLYLGNSGNVGLYVFSDIIGSEPGAPVFMTLMGLSIVFSKHQSPRFLATRSLNMFAIGYILSAFRTLLPMLIFGGLDEWCTLDAFFVVDILQFAGLSLLLMALFKKLRVPSWAILLISLGMVGIGQIVLSLPEPLVQKTWAGYFVNLFFPVTEWSCFPLFIWFFFPAFGLCFGEVLIRCKDKNKMYGILLPLSLCGILYIYLQFHSLYPDYARYYYGNNFYYMGIKNVLLTSAFVLFVFAFWHFADKILPNFLRATLVFLSTNLNTYYIITWVYISVLIHLSAYFKICFTAIQTVGLMAVLLAICILTTKAYLALKGRHKK